MGVWGGVLDEGNFIKCFGRLQKFSGKQSLDVFLIVDFISNEKEKCYD